ncbi:CBS domain-containing protein [Cupriavidus sp. H39]|uniref:CBS domain-containing protein n=1 Tax=Cupriavidus sp. H39 TaxID=3401635 RepID=UPI003D07088C
MKAEEICSRQLFHVCATATLKEAASRMRDHGVGILLVTNDLPTGHRVAGIITERDIVVLGVASGMACDVMRVEAAMTTGVVTIHRGAQVG